MCNVISCLVNRSAKVYAKDGEHSHSKIALIFKVNEDRCLRYEFRLVTRTLFQDFTMDGAPFEAKQSHDQAAQSFFDECAGTPEKLMAYVQRGNWYRNILSDLLTGSARVEYDKADASALAEYNKASIAAWVKYYKVRDAAEAKYDKASAVARAKYDKAIAGVWAKYDKACMETWLRLFKNPANRIKIWKK